MISHTKEIIIKVSCYDVEKLIFDIYGYGFEIVSDMELGNQSIDISIENKELNNYEFRDIKRFRETGYSSYLTHTLLKDLCGLGLLEEGNYLIDCTW